MQIAREFGIQVARSKNTQKEDAVHEPFSREQSKQAARLFAAEHPLPLRLLRDVKVVQFGSPSKEFSTEDNLVMLNYRSRWADAQSKVVFESRVEEGDGKSPSYNVYAIDTNDEGKKLRYPLAKGASPDDVWNKVAERQRHILHKEKRLQDGGQQCSSPGGSSGSVVDGILKKCSHLSSIWGLEKFGFIDLTCLKAMEGQDGVEDTGYKYVNERHGWVQQQMRLRELLSQRGQKLRLKPRSKPSGESKVNDKVVERLVETMVKKVCTLQEKYEAKVARQEERARKRELKQQENEKKKKEKPVTNRAPVEDTELPGWESMPPAAVALSSLVSSESTIDESSASHLVEAWLLAYRFRKLLFLDAKSFPSMQDMAKWYYQDAEPDTERQMCSIMNAFVEFLTHDLCESALDAILDGNNALKRIDFAPGTRSAHVIVNAQNNWQDVLHRYLFIVAMAAGLSDNEKVHYINYPMEYVHPYHIMESMTSGPTGLEVATGDLNPLLPKEAEWRIRARRDALCCLESMKIVGGDSLTGAVDDISRKKDKALRLIFAALFKTISDSGGKFLDVCFDGQDAALEARHGMPIDFALIGAKVECMVYQLETDWLNSFAADSFYAWKMLRTALQREGNKFGSDKVVSRKQDVLNKVLMYLRDIVDYANTHDLDQVLAKLESDNSDAANIHETAELIPRNISPSNQHCFICWLNQDQESFEACMSCGKHAHGDCLIREDELGCSRQSKTPGEYVCLLCSSQKHSPMDRRENYISFPGSYGHLWTLVRDLGDSAIDTWTPSHRLELLRILSLLLSEHPSVRETLQNEETRYKNLRKTLVSSRNELKAIQSGKQQDATQEKSIRQAREEEIMKEKLVMKISKAEEDLKYVPKGRITALGVDRHWNRYWPLPNVFLNSKEPCILVEKVSTSSEPFLYVYDSLKTIGELSEFLNPAGQRENSLKAEIDRFTKDSTALDDQQQSKPEHDEPPMADSPMELEIVSDMDRFKTALIDYAQGLPKRLYHEIRGTPNIQEQWTNGVQSIASHQQALAYVILLERMLDASCFKVHWRLWAVPAPHPLGVTTLSAAWNRLENLKKAIKPSVNQSYSLSMMHIEDVDDDKGHHEPHPRVQYDDYAMRDEELAKQLDAELNQRRRGRTRESDSGRGKRPRSSINLRNVSKKYYGEDEDSSPESDESSSSYDTSSSSSEQEHSSKEDDEDSDIASMDIGTE